jgi:hypothetical protein
MIVRFNLERDRPAVADLHNAGVVPDPGEHPLPHRLGGGVREVAQVHLRRLVRAVLAPHHRIHRQLGGGGPAPENLEDPRVLIVGQTQFPVRLLNGHHASRVCRA